MSRLNDSGLPLERPPICAASPILLSLIPLIAGIVMIRLDAWIILALGLPVICLPRIPFTSRLVVAMSFLCGIILTHLATDLPHPLWDELPPREVQVTMEITELFNARRAGRLSGIARIRRSDVPFDTVSNRMASFYMETETDHPPGTIVSCLAVLTYIPWMEAPEDFHLYLKNRDIYLTLNRGSIREMISGPPWHEKVRRRAYRYCQKILSAGAIQPADPGYVLASMMLGNRTLLNDERIDLYRQTGTYHLFAVSGLHVGSVALCLHWLGGLARLGGSRRLLPVLAATWAYVWLTGNSPSAIRAGIMITCLGTARQLPRQPHLFPALALSAWLVLIWQPMQLFALGFQLSYCVVGAIILMGLPMARAIRQLLGPHINAGQALTPFPRWAMKALTWTIDLACVSLSAGLASMPLIIQHFQLFTPISIILGIILNPLATLCVMAGCIVLILGLLTGPGLAGLMAQATWWPIRFMEFLLSGSLGIPGAFSHRDWPWPGAGTSVVLAALASSWLIQHRRQWGWRPHGVFHLIPHFIILISLLFTVLHT